MLRKSSLLGLQKDNPPFGGFNVTALGKAKRLLMSPGPIFEPEGQTGDYRRARTVRGRLARGRRGAQLLLLSSHARRLPARGGAHALGCAVIPAGWEYRGPAQRDRAVEADRLCGHAGFPENPARCGRRGRQGRILVPARPRLRCGAAAFTAQGTGERGVAREAMLRGRRGRRHRLRVGARKA